MRPETTVVSSVITELPPTVSKAKPGNDLSYWFAQIDFEIFFKKQIQQIRERKFVVQNVHIVLIYPMEKKERSENQLVVHRKQVQKYRKKIFISQVFFSEYF
jgi:hypothetical protein